MPLHKLYLFAKNTDATATEQGFQYQKLKTLETWLKNRINKVDEVIYCDYEDDIFQRNLKDGTAKFRQIKLYSSNFSFSKEEIQKSLFHFFMLFIKGDYKFDDVEFFFETNSGVAREVRGNDANLLRDWASKQDSMDDKLKIDCRERVKAIIDEYIADNYDEKNSAENQLEFQEAKEIYDQLSDEVWNKFISSIKWKFDAVPQEKAIPILLQEITDLVPELPLPINTEKATAYISLLHFEIAQRTAQPNEDGKILTNDLLDIILLNAGSEEDVWYAETYNKWTKVGEIRYFTAGAFYEVVSAARHCRWEVVGSGHDTLWKSLLSKYIDLSDTPIVCRRKAIYEYLFLRFAIDPKSGLLEEMISGCEDWVRYYFNQIEYRSAFVDFKEDISLLQSIEGISSVDQETSLTKEEIETWKKSIGGFIDEKIANHINTDELCLAYELRGDFTFNFNRTIPLKDNINAAIESYRKILTQLKNTTTYSISGLSDQLIEILKMLIDSDVEEEIVESIENFIGEIDEYAVKTGKQHNAAHNLVERGALYMKKGSSKNFLRALDCFHKAKNLWYLQDTKDGYILALLNIAQLYLAIGMNLAAKYYGLCGVWASVYFGDFTVLKRVSDSYAIVLKADFQQGAWINAIDNFRRYIFSRLEFKTDAPYIDKDNILRVTLSDLACILAATPALHPEMKVFVDFTKKSLGDVYTGYVQVFEEKLVTIFKEEKALHKVLNSKLSSTPLNDVGTERVISFRASGIEWKILFDNTAILNAVGEGFGAIIQTVLCELNLSGYDFHLLQIPVTIYVTEGVETIPRLSQRSSYEESVWDLSIPLLKSSDNAGIRLYSATLLAILKTLISNISLLPTDEFNAAFEELAKKQMIGDKVLSTNAYQKVYFNLQTVEEFNESRRADFSPLHLKDEISCQIDFLPIHNDISGKYNKETALDNISKRYVNIKKKLSVSLPKWVHDVNFINLVHELREKGWLDWQILTAIQNYVLSAKVEMHMKSTGETDPRLLKKIGDDEFLRISNLNEKDCYVEIPVEWLRTELFDFYLIKTPVDTLESYYLQNGMNYPNFKGVHKFLNQRFNFNVDDVSENNPLKDI